jgi:hypothetical protein
MAAVAHALRFPDAATHADAQRLRIQPSIVGADQSADAHADCAAHDFPEQHAVHNAIGLAFDHAELLPVGAADLDLLFTGRAPSSALPAQLPIRHTSVRPHL